MSRKSRAFISTEAESHLEVAGRNIDLARKRRKLRIKDVCQAARITPQTYRRLCQGDPGVSIGVMIAVLQTLNLGAMFAAIADPVLDREGQFLALQELDQKKRIKLGVDDAPDTDF